MTPQPRSSPHLIEVEKLQRKVGVAVADEGLPLLHPLQPELLVELLQIAARDHAVGILGDLRVLGAHDLGQRLGGGGAKWWWWWCGCECECGCE
jgi:hypothetical protein